jgi:16S rRNA (cytosine967-C5)-methyltransferase
MERLYGEIERSKEPFDEIIFGECFLFGQCYADINSDWRQLEGTPERKIKGRFDELSKVRALKESIQIGWMK